MNIDTGMICRRVYRYSQDTLIYTELVTINKLYNVMSGLTVYIK